MKQTAVEFLIYHIRQDTFVHSKSTKEWNEVFQQAKEMEKEQMIDFARNIIIDATCSVEGYVTTEKDIEEYYNETFNTNKK
jgi:uncharacterized protein YdeI (BOF family)